MTASSLFQLLTRGVEDVSVNTILIFSHLFIFFFENLYVRIRIAKPVSGVNKEGLLWVSAKT